MWKFFRAFQNLPSQVQGAWKRSINHPGAVKMSDNTILATPAPSQGLTTPRKGPPKFKQRQTRQFKSKPPKKGVKGYHSDLPLGGIQSPGTARACSVWDYLRHQRLHHPPSWVSALNLLCPADLQNLEI
ncbi:retinal cone rhodopsin-sensitive cGMP 3',5'-cyclic phosphodiesterase subunit gamma [Fukomys damarensis]|uniref:retinal cone rhodopsin-sensitive cGMP 3',5'-cyclic phosphodiesterase subunit gamma n=1 Tax=Fukomys damarensis TaxID=885580 RepID=UPI0014555467|nr:retinal cone rhodopsin-sensitive cGMP 3',5'-cyclic phosphodiesterase subunit gamma [Fukomys damarensis]